jgi:hypothetical protein
VDAFKAHIVLHGAAVQHRPSHNRRVPPLTSSRVHKRHTQLLLHQEQVTLLRRARGHLSLQSNHLWMQLLMELLLTGAATGTQTTSAATF